MLGQGGRYLEIGNISPGMQMSLDPSALVSGNKSIHGVLYYDKQAIKRAIEFLSRTKGKYPFDKILSKSYSLEQINEAFEAQAKGLVSRSAIIP
jgi:Zn-dependent alcohol dehydrogenase